MGRFNEKKFNTYLLIKQLILLTVFVVLFSVKNVYAANLTSLEIEGYNNALNPTFSPNTYEYSTFISKNDIDINFSYQKENSSDTVKITNNKHIKNNEGTVTIDVSGTKYKINYTKVDISKNYVFSYTGGAQSFTVPLNIKYKLEAWGARGGEAYTATGYAGKGAYTRGNIDLTHGEILYVYVGQVGGTYTGSSASGPARFNGGGSSYSGCSCTSFGTGGGATDFRLTNGNWNNFDSLKTRIMVAAGGGGAAWWDGGGYASGGAGGGLTGGSGYHLNRNSGVTTRNTTGGTQTSGGKNNYAQVTGSFGIGGNGNTGAGGGYYGGGNGQDLGSSISGAAGGSSFISGFSGCDSITRSSTSSSIVHSGESTHYSGKVFTNMAMASGNETMPTFDGTSTMTGNTSNGQAKVTPLSGVIDRDNYLDSLESDNGTLSPTFDPIVNEYTLTLDMYDQDFTLTGELSNEKAIVLGLDKTYEMRDKDNETVEITVISENGDIKIYTINATRPGIQNGEHSSKLKQLDVVGYEYDIDPKFDGRTTNYDLEILSNEIDLDINYRAFDKDATVTISGNRLMVEEYGVITVTVTAPSVSSTVYRINWTRKEVERENVYDYTGNYQTFTAQKTGDYQIELWGARGGESNGTAGYAGKGGYTKGVIKLKKGETLYIYPGQIGNNYRNSTGPATWNGGGSVNAGQWVSFGSGGGATDVRLTPGTWNDFDSLKSRIMVAAGGGGAAWWTEGGYTKGGAGGGLTGGEGVHLNWNSGVTTRNSTGGTQTSGGKNNYAQITGTFGIGGSGNTGGGGGYYGGGTGQDLSRSVSGAGGGSSFISGYEGCNAIYIKSTSNNIMHTGDSVHYSGKVFTNMVMSSGNETMPTFDGTSTMTGNSGAGHAKITLLNDTRDKNNYLFNLTTDKGKLTPKFDTSVQEYTVRPDAYATSITLDGEAYSDKATVTGFGEYDLVDIDSKDVNITVTAENGETRIYTVHIKKYPVSGHSSLLKQLYLTKYTDLIKYDSETSVYNVEIPDTEIELPISYIPFDPDANVTITGNTFNDVRNNNSGSITILVEAPDCEEKIYKINWSKVSESIGKNFGYTGGEQTFTATKNGYYKLETWGAQGGIAIKTYTVAGGYGAYSTGITKLNENDKLYINVGGQGQTMSGCSASGHTGYNGGGYGACISNSAHAGGGGATHIATVSGLLKNLEKYKGTLNAKGTTYDSNEILIVSGAGGGAQSHSAPFAALGGHGGGYIGQTTNNPSGGYGYGTGGTQLKTGHYVKNSRDEGYNGWVAGEGSIGNDRLPNIPAAFGQGKNYSYTETSNGTYNGGGGGWYGGYSSWHTGGGGGSGYIGSSKLISAKTSNKHMASYNVSNKSNEEEIRTISTSCSNATATADCTKTGDGYAKISFLTTGTDNYLLNIESDNGTLSPKFDPEKNEYNLVLDPYIPEFTLTGELSDENADVVGLGKYEIEGTTMDVEVAVTSLSGDTRVYTIHVSMEPAADRNIKLKKLNIEDYVLDPKFHPLTEEYTVEIGAGSMYVDVEAIPFDKDAKVTIEGNGYLPLGKKNIIIITVEKDNRKTIYKVNVEREGSVEGEEYSYNCTGEYQEFVAPATAYYKIEAWGARGGYGRTNWSLKYRGGLGAYTSGEIRLKKNEKIYIYVGCEGQNGGSSSRFIGGPGGWNGGSQGGDDSNMDSYPDAGGGSGGATDIRLVQTSSKSIWNEFDSLKSRIMVAAGGGGGNYNGIGGSGGTLTGLMGYGSKSIPTQTSGYSFGLGQVGITSNDGSGAGAGGYYGGYTAASKAGSGGSSYVSGCEGCVGVSEDSTENNIISTGESIHYSGYSFDNITMLSGDDSMPNPNGGYSVGNNGDGKVIITAGRDRSSDNYLRELSVDKGTLSPEFDMQKLDYDVTLDRNDDEITISAKLSDDTASITGTGTFDVPDGTTEFPVTVTAENGEIRVYTVSVSREKSNNSKPKDIVVSGLIPSLCALNPDYCNVEPEFNPNTNQYTITVPARIKQVEFTVIKGHKYQTIIGDGIVSLEGGSNLFTIEVKSEDKTSTSTYTYNVIRDMTGDTTIEDLKVVNPSININFDPDLTEYYFSIPNINEELELEVTLEDPLASYEVIGNENFKVGLNIVIIRVTAQNGETKDYVLNAYREKSGNIFLSDLKVKHNETEYELNPVFNKITTTYVVNVPNEIDVVTIEATQEHPLTTIVGLGEKTLKTGVNNFDITTTSEDGTTEVYKVSIIRSKNNDATLKTLDVLEASLDEEFDPSVNEYSLEVAPGISQLNINAIANKDTSTVTISGNSGFKVGSNVVQIIVTAEDGTKNIYKLNVERIPSTNNYLTALTTDRYDLLEEFDKDTLEYNITLENEIKDITVSAIKEDQLSKVTGTGKYNLKTGNNDIKVVVTSEDGNNRTYTLHVFRKLNNNANLFSISFNPDIELSQEFNKNVISYTAEVDNLVDKITILGVPEANTSVVDGNGSYDLVVGENNITIKVTAEDNTEKEYTFVITRKKSDNANLIKLSAREGLLEPSFNKNIESYTIKVLDSVTSLTLDYLTENAAATVEVLGNSNFEIGNNIVKIRVTSEDKKVTKEYILNVLRQEEGTASSKLSSLSMVEASFDKEFDSNVMYYEAEVPYSISAVTLEGTLEDINASVIGLGQHNIVVGENILSVQVTSTEGIVRTYQVLVKRLENDEARLSNLIIEGSSLTPAFNKDVYEYQLQTQNTKLNISATPIDPGATYEVIGNEDLQLGNSDITIRVTAKDGYTTKDYVLHTEKLKSNNNNLAYLEVEGVILSPAFSKSTTVYYGTVDREVNTIQINGEPEDKNATVDGLGENNLDVGVNYIEVSVTSESGKVKKYTLVITRTPNSNNYLASLIPSVSTLDKEFDKTVTEYNVTVPYEENLITFTGTTEDDTAKVSGLDKYDLNVGVNVIKVTVTSESGNDRVYTVNVTREEIVSSLLSKLSVKDYSLTPNFNSDVFDYNVTVDNEIESLNLNYETLDSGASVVVEGNENFKVGLNVVNLIVTDREGKTTSTYTLNVNRQPYSNTFLAYISVSKGELVPLFDKKTLSYDVSVENSVESIDIDAEAEVDSNTVSGIGTYNLELGNNKIPITVTSPTGIKRTYYVNVYRSLRDDNYLLSLQAKVNGELKTLTPTFNKDTNSYTLNVDVGTTSIYFSGTYSYGASVVGLGNQNVKLGENNYTIAVTSESGKINNYIIKVTRPASSENKLASLIPSSGTLSPTFTYVNNEYTLKLDSSVNFLSFEYTSLDRFAIVSGTSSAIVPDGESVREIIVTAEDGTINKYTINIIKDRTDEARLQSLSVTGYNLTPVFDSDTKNYTLTVPNSKKTLLASEVEAIAIDKNASVSKGGSLTLSSVTSNLYTIVVTAKDGFTKENYYITINREKGSEALLSSLKTNIGDLTPVFDTNTFNYTLTVPNGLNKLTAEDFEATATEEDAKVTKKQKLLISDEGSNIYTITVTSGDKKATNTYKINIEKLASSDATLKELITDIGIMTPEFNRLNYVYRVDVSKDAEEIIVNAKPNSFGTVLGGTGKTTLTGETTKIQIPVQAEDGTIQIYELNVVRSLNTSLQLESLSLSGDCTEEICPLEPIFEKDTLDYEVLVTNDIKRVQVDYTKKYESQIVKVYDSANNEIEGLYTITNGDNILRVEVTNELNESREYKIRISREKSKNNYLKELSITDPDVESAKFDFDKDILEYYVTVPVTCDEITLNAVKEHSKATIRTSGTKSLSQGNNDVVITVQAENGSIREYIIHVLKDGESNNYLSNLTVSSGTIYKLSPKFNKGMYDYVATVPSNISKVNIDAVPELNTTTVSGTGEKTIKTGFNSYDIVSTSKDGIIATYHVIVNKEKAEKLYLKSLSINEGTLSPEFDKENMVYTTNISEDINSLTINAVPEENDVTVKIVGNNNLISGENNVYIILSNKDKTITTTYVIKANKALSDNNYLKSIKVDDNELMTLDKRESTEFSIDVNYDVDQINLTSIPEFNLTTIEGNGLYSLNYGENNIELKSTSESGNTRIYNIIINRKYCNDLFMISTDRGEISPNFDKDILTYNLEVNNDIKDINIIAVPLSDAVSIEGNGQHNLEVGENIIQIIVSSPNNSSKTYTLKVNRKKSSDNTLNNLYVVEGVLTPDFDKNTENYRVEVPYNVNKVTIDYELSDKNSTVKIKGNENLTTGDNEVIVEVTAENGDKKEYKITVYVQDEELYSNKLKSLNVDKGKLSPNFDPEVSSYTVTVTNNIDSINLIGVLESVEARATGLGRHNLELGRNEFPIVVTSKDGKKRTYSVVVYRIKSSDARLRQISFEEGVLSPIFDKDTSNYTMTVDSSVNKLTETVLPLVNGTTYEITGNKNLVIGENTVTVVATAGDGFTTRAYTIKVTKEISNDNLLDSLSSNVGTITPSFNKDNTGPYIINVDETINSIVLIGKPNSSTSTVTGFGVHSINKGSNTIPIIVTSEAGTTRTYTVIVNKALSDDNSLYLLKTSDGELSPEFNKDTIEYNVEVDEEVNEITVLGLATNSKAKVDGNGKYELSEGTNNINITVTAENGNKRIYKLNIIKAKDASSKILKLNAREGVLSPTFDKNTLEYSITVPYEVKNLTLDIELEDSESTYLVEGNENFKVGSNQVFIRVTSKKNVTTTYTLNVIRQTASNNYLKSLTLSDGNLTPEFDRSVQYYEVVLDGIKENITIDSSPEDSRSTINGNGTYSLVKGDNYIYITVTSNSGVERTYTIKVERKKSSNNKLLSLSVNTGELTPSFDPDTNIYETVIQEGINEINIRAVKQDNNSVISGDGKKSVEEGENVYEITVTAEDGSINIYKIIATKTASSNNNIENIIPSSGALSPNYTSTIDNYEVEVEEDISLISFDVILEDNSAKVSGNNDIPLDYGENNVTIKVTAENGNEKVVNINVIRNKNITSIEVENEDVLMAVNDLYKIEPIILPEDATNKEVIYTSSDESIATVNNEGEISSKKIGNVDITISSKKNPNIKKIVKVSVLNLLLSSDVYDVRHGDENGINIVIGSEEGIFLQEYISNINNNQSLIKAYGLDAEEIKDLENTYATTGQILTIEYNGKVYDRAWIVMRGDNTEDGAIDVADYNELRKQVLGTNNFEGYLFKSVDIEEDDEADVADYNKLKQYLLGKLSSLNN